MTAEHFSYWLQGFFELTGSNNLTEEQVSIIKDHLQLVFHKETPNREFRINIGGVTGVTGSSGHHGSC